jgi:hypothetical protein
MKTVWWRANDPELCLLSHVDWASGLYYPMLRRFFNTFFKGTFPETGMSTYIQHYAHVRTLVPKENLLEYSVGDGWEPLCKLLGHNIPGDAFPQGNNVENFIPRSRNRNRKQFLNVITRYVAYAFVLIFLLMLLL